MKARIFYRRELFYSATGYVIVFTGLLIIFIEIVHSQPLIIAGMIALFLPVLLLPVLLRIYSRDVYVDLHPDRFHFKVIGRRGEVDKTFLLSALECYMIQYPTAFLATVRLKSVGQRAVELSFFRKKSAATDGDVDEMVGLIQQTITEYNARQADGRRIMVFPSFFASRAGLWSIILLSVCLVAGIVLANIYRKETAVFYPAGGLLALMIARRYREMKGKAE